VASPTIRGLACGAAGVLADAETPFTRIYSDPEVDCGVVMLGAPPRQEHLGAEDPPQFRI
jgi:hypothetical protein